MESFLKQVASSLIQKYGDNISQVTLVFPNKRAGIFFSNYLNSLVTKPIISPEIITISELFATISQYHVPDRLNLIIRLYSVYRDLTSSTESFDDFYHWGNMLISDFDQVDKYMINARDLFTNISELKEIDSRFSINQIGGNELFKNFWESLGNDNRTRIQQEFLKLWKDLADIYEKFISALHSENMAYEGMLYRNAVGLLVSNKVPFIKDKQFAFVGFNALNRCEEVLFEYLLRSENAKFFWDYDNYYLQDSDQEAGLFLRKNLSIYPQQGKSIHQPDLLASKVNSFKIINIASQTGQAQVAGDELSILFNSNGKFKFDDTAIVLCDEELLLPLISAIPDQIDKVNVTMGFPLILTTVFSFINQLTSLLKNCRNNRGEPAFYHQDVLDILNHQLIMPFEPEQRKELSGFIMTNNLIYLSSSLLVKNELYRLIFSLPDSIQEQLEYFLKILNKVFLFWEKNDSIENSYIYREFIFRTYTSINNLKEIIVNWIPKIFGQEDFMSANTFGRILKQYLGDVTIPFEGEPLEGLQVMGILETRALDFNNIIMLSVNDGVMPKISMSGSFIPYNLRCAFGLPTIEEQNAMYAYYFYRLLQRADNVLFIYNSGANGLITGEKSRYLYQLQMESQFNIAESTVTYKTASIKTQAITISKDEKVMALLNNYLDGRTILSPTSLDKYLSCSLQFYFMYVAGLKEPEEIAEDVDAQIFGLLFHKSMEYIYKPLESRMLDKSTIDKIIKDSELIEETIHNAFKKVYFKGTGEEEKVELLGKNRLIIEIVRKYILQILSLDSKRTPFKIEGVETRVSVKVPINQEMYNVLIGGTIDRIDRLKDYLLIIDYKTGKTELSYLSLSSLFDKENKTRNKAAFQTLVYSYLLYKSSSHEKSIKPGIYDLRSIFKQDYDVFIKCKEDGNKAIDFILIASQCEEYIMKLLEEIFDANIPFEQTKVEENCAYCPYKQICRC